MFTLAAWSASVDQAAIAPIAAVGDPHLTASGNDVRVPGFASKLMGVYILGVNVTQAQIQSPSLRALAPFDVEPLDRAATPSNPPLYNDLYGHEYEFVVDESINMSLSEDAAGASRMSAFAWLTDGNYASTSGEIFTIRATSATAAVAFTWSNVPLTFPNILPAGTYAIVGFRPESTTMLAARLVLPGYGHRPGAIGQTAVSRVQDVENRFRYGNLGVWGSFRNTVPPTVDVFAGAADATQTFWLDLIKQS